MPDAKKSPEYWATKTDNQLKQARYYNLRTRKPLPPELIAEMEKRKLIVDGASKNSIILMAGDYEQLAEQSLAYLYRLKNELKRKNRNVPQTLHDAIEERRRYSLNVSEITPDQANDPKFWARLSNKNLQNAYAHYKDTSAAIPEPLIKEFKKRRMTPKERSVATPTVSVLNTYEYWAARTDTQLQNSLYYYKTKGPKLPAMLMKVLKEREMIDETIPKDNMPRIDGTIPVVAKYIGRGIDATGIYDIHVNGKPVLTGFLAPMFRVAMGGRILLVSDGANGPINAFLPGGRHIEFNRRNITTGEQLTIRNAYPTYLGLKLVLSDSTTMMVGKQEIQENSPKYDMSRIPSKMIAELDTSKMLEEEESAPQPGINFNDGDYHIYRQPIDQHFYNVYLNGKKIMSNTPGITIRTYFNDHVLAIRANHVNDLHSRWQVYDMMGERYVPESGDPTKVGIREIVPTGGRLRLLMTNGEIEYLDCRAAEATKIRRMKYKVH